MTTLDDYCGLITGCLTDGSSVTGCSCSIRLTLIARKMVAGTGYLALRTTRRRSPSAWSDCGADGLIAVDWGTTNRRIYVIEDRVVTLTEADPVVGTRFVNRFEQSVTGIRVPQTGDAARRSHGTDRGSCPPSG